MQRPQPFSPGNSGKPAKPRSLDARHYIFAGVLLIRLLVFAQLSVSPFLLPAHGDMHFYDDWARRIAHGQLSDHLAFYGLPGYAYLLAALYHGFGYNPFAPAMLQALADAGTAALIYSISVRVFAGTGTRLAQMIGILAAIGWAFCVPAQTYSVVLMPTALVVFVFWLVVWWIVRDQTPSEAQALEFGLLMGLTATMIATILFLVPLVAGAILIKPVIEAKTRIPTRITSLALLVAGVLIGTAPCWIHNYFVAHDRVFLSAHSGINFWIGNNPTSTGYPRFPPGLRAGQAAMLEDSITAAESAAGHPLKRGEVSEFWSAKARDYIRHNFGGWLRLLAAKLRNFWNGFQYDDLSVITSLRERGVTLPGVYFGLVAALALPGILLAWKTISLSRWLTFAIALHLVAVLSVFTTERYRLPVVPGLLIFAAFALVTLWQNLLTRNVKPVIAYTALLFGSTALGSWPQRDPSLWALDTYNSGLQALDSGNLDIARQKLDLAYRYSPENAEINFAQGNLHLALGDSSAAKTFYRSALQLYPAHSGALNNLGVLALKEKRWDLAATFLRRALAGSPHDPKIYYLLAETHLKLGHRNSARAEIEEAIRLAPAQPEFRTLQQQIQALEGRQGE